MTTTGSSSPVLLIRRLFIIVLKVAVQTMMRRKCRFAPFSTMKPEGHTLQRILESAYRAFDPQQALKPIPVTQALLAKLLPESVFALAKELNNPPTLCQDLLNYRAQAEKQWSDDALHCQFVYFATSMIHIFGGKSAVAYSEPNVSIPYVWINVLGADSIELVNYCSRFEKDIFRVIMHVVHPKGYDKENPLIHRIDTVKKSINLRNGGLVMTFSMGNAIQICLRLDLEQPVLTMNAAHPTARCIVLLSYKGEFMGAWQRGKEKLVWVQH